MCKPVILFIENNRKISIHAEVLSLIDCIFIPLIIIIISITMLKLLFNYFLIIMRDKLSEYIVSVINIYYKNLGYFFDAL